VARGHLTEAEQNDDLLTPGQVAAIFAVDPKTVTRWAREGRVAFLTTPGGHRRYRRSEIDRLKEGTTTHE
jgi:excisionase family DNA binding protein